MKKSFILFLFFISTLAFCQKKGETNTVKNYLVTYEQSSNIDDQLAQIPDENLRQQLKNQLNKPKLYELLFNSNESLYRKSKAKSTPKDDLAKKPNVQVITIENKFEMYKNIKTNTFLKNTSIQGKEFLVSINPITFNWKIENSSKKIGDFECIKALTTENGHLVEAWFTNDIPFSGGPEYYQGLPGLIIELKTTKKYYLATNISENSSEKIVVPEKGKKVTEEEFQKIQEETLNDIKSGIFNKN